jgi:hypothetical protein
MKGADFTNKRNGDVISFCIADTAAVSIAFLKYDKSTWLHEEAEMKGITTTSYNSLEVYKIVNFPAEITTTIDKPCIAWRVPATAKSGTVYYGGFTYKNSGGAATA